MKELNYHKVQEQSYEIIEKATNTKLFDYILWFYLILFLTFQLWKRWSKKNGVYIFEGC